MCGMSVIQTYTDLSLYNASQRSFGSCQIYSEYDFDD